MRKFDGLVKLLLQETEIYSNENKCYTHRSQNSLSIIQMMWNDQIYLIPKFIEIS